MTLTLTTTAGATDSNAYCSLAEFEAYIATMTFATEATAKTDENKKAAIIQSARWLDTLQFRGARSSETQSMAWPRCEAATTPRFLGLTVDYTGYLTDRDGYEVDSATVPVCVKNANAELALRQLGTDWTKGLGPVLVESQSVGSISQGRKTHKAFPAAVLAMLSPFLAVMSGSGGRLVRG